MGICLFARRSLKSRYSPGRIYSMYFLEKYTSNEAQTKIKTLFKAERTFLRGICYSTGEYWNLVIRPGKYTSCIFSRNIRLMKFKQR